MTTLPSFVELMASLGLENRPEPAAEGVQSKHHSRSSSYSSSSSIPSDASSAISTPHSNIFTGSSPAIVVSQHEESPVERDWEPEKRRCRMLRYSPYSPSIVSFCDVLQLFEHLTNDVIVPPYEEGKYALNES